MDQKDGDVTGKFLRPPFKLRRSGKTEHKAGVQPFYVTAPRGNEALVSSTPVAMAGSPLGAVPRAAIALVDSLSLLSASLEATATRHSARSQVPCFFRNSLYANPRMDKAPCIPSHPAA